MSKQQGGYRCHLISSQVLPDSSLSEQEQIHRTEPDSIEGILFTHQARKALTHAQEKANSFFHNYIDSYHLLLGLFQDPHDAPTIIMRHLGINAEQITNMILASIHPGQAITLGEKHFTKSFRTAIFQTAEEAQKLNQAEVGSEHLLLGLSRTPFGINGSVFLRLGITADQIRDQIQQLPPLSS